MFIHEPYTQRSGFLGRMWRWSRGPWHSLKMKHHQHIITISKTISRTRSIMIVRYTPQGERFAEAASRSFFKHPLCYFRYDSSRVILQHLPSPRNETSSRVSRRPYASAHLFSKRDENKLLMCLRKRVRGARPSTLLAPLSELHPTKSKPRDFRHHSSFCKAPPDLKHLVTYRVHNENQGCSGRRSLFRKKRNIKIIDASMRPSVVPDPKRRA